jgi:hypothetical protein
MQKKTNQLLENRVRKIYERILSEGYSTIEGNPENTKKFLLELTKLCQKYQIVIGGQVYMGNLRNVRYDSLTKKSNGAFELDVDFEFE